MRDSNTKRYSLQTPDFGARSLATKDIFSKSLTLVRDRFTYPLRFSTKRYPLQTPDFGARSLHLYFGVKWSRTERQHFNTKLKFSTKRYPLQIVCFDFGAKSLKLKGIVSEPKDIHSKLLILVRDR